MKQHLRELPLQSVQVKDAFWSARQNTIMDVTIPYMEEVLNDRIEGIDRSHAIENFRAAAKESEESFYGMVFQDSDVYKWIEATAYALMVRPDAALEKRLDDVIALIGRAQQPDGYINTYFTLKVEPRFSNLLECHELYCAGHLLEAAVACYEALGKRELLEIGEKLCACLMNQFAEDDIPGHQEIEIGLLRMYHVTGRKEYLDLSLKALIPIGLSSIRRRIRASAMADTILIRRIPSTTRATRLCASRRMCAVMPCAWCICLRPWPMRPGVREIRRFLTRAAR